MQYIFSIFVPKIQLSNWLVYLFPSYLFIVVKTNVSIPPTVLKATLEHDVSKSNLLLYDLDVKLCFGCIKDYALPLEQMV